MYFVLARMMTKFHYLHYGISVVLILVGAKMMISHHVKIPTVWTLGTVIFVLATSIVASMLTPPAVPGD
jgi:tellurite resistance protein TerC